MVDRYQADIDRSEALYKELNTDFLEKKIDQEMGIARKNAKTNKRAALQALKRKKRYDRQLQQIDGTLTTIEQQRNALEDANTNTEVLKNMGEAAKALKKAHADMDIDQVKENSKIQKVNSQVYGSIKPITVYFKFKHSLFHL